jgi:hypothetical protein
MNAHAARPLTPNGVEACIHAINAAALDGDFDEARLGLAQFREQLQHPRLDALRRASNILMSIFGPPGTTPSGGLGRALVDLTEAFEKIQPG